MSSVERQNAERGDGLSRRRWLQLMGASMALAGAAGCRWEKREVLPFAKRPPGRVPGKTEAFATVMELGGASLGLLVTCVDGRPIKIEGNPQHPGSLGGTNAFAQASILELYDPDRSQSILEKTREGEEVRSWDEFAAFVGKHFDQLRKSGGAGLAVLAEPTCSPTLSAMRKKVLDAYPKAQWHEYSPLAAPESLAVGPHYALDKADMIIALGADLFGADPAAVRYAHDFAKRRDASQGSMNRLYVVESSLTITGATADHRLALSNRQIGRFVNQLVRELASGKPSKRSAANYHPADRFVRALARDIREHHGRCVFVAGPALGDNSQVLALNVNFGESNVTFIPANAAPAQDRTRVGSIEALVSDIDARRATTLVVLGGNPAYDAPADIPLAKSLAEIETTIHLGVYRNETAGRCKWHVPQAHFLEAWGDARGDDGRYAVAQPMIEPLHGGRSAIGLLALLLGEPSRGDVEWLRDEFRGKFGADDFERRWRAALHDGIVEGAANSSPAVVDVKLDAAAASDFQPEWDGRTLELVFRPDAKAYDGRFGNNGWLQELPDPLLKITWDNAAVMSPATAAKLGVGHEDVVKLKFKGREIEAPVYVLPGQADGVVAVTLGYGRTAAGKVGGSEADGVAPVGFSAYKLRTYDAMWFGTGLEVEPTGRKHEFATTHDRLWIDKAGTEGRAERIGELARETTLAEAASGQWSVDSKKASHESAGPHPNPFPKGEGTEGRGEGTEVESLWDEHQYTGRRWGMAIDLSKCVGCGACVVACQAENNIPIVGKERVLRGREMHWLRIDRYFRGDLADARVAFQPLTCQQCELAPCEQVCPVGATTHSSEGLNDMAYNRCIGVRYCANNCPFKVRRFNFFNYHKDFDDPANEVMKMAYNPQVTVRSRGVMEKCTYCVQRIQAAKIEAKNHGRAKIADGEIRTACQQACPAGAIVFGDLADPQSEVAKLHRSMLAYRLLDELNVKPRTSYLARVRNPNPALEDRD